MVANNEWVIFPVFNISKKKKNYCGKWVVFGSKINFNFFPNLFTSLFLKRDLISDNYEQVKNECLDF